MVSVYLQACPLVRVSGIVRRCRGGLIRSGKMRILVLLILTVLAIGTGMSAALAERPFDRCVSKCNGTRLQSV